MRAFLYCRFSSQKQQELSIDGQRDICLEYAEKHEHHRFRRVYRPGPKAHGQKTGQIFAA